MRISGAFRALLLFSTLKGGASESMKGLLRNSEIPDSGKEWVTLENGVQYQPAHENLSRKLTGNLFGGSPYRKAFVDGTETYYDEDAQAWRLLGFYIDCNSREDDLESGESEEAYRDLEEENDAYFETTCMRYLVWAAVSKISCGTWSLNLRQFIPSLLLLLHSTLIQATREVVLQSTSSLTVKQNNGTLPHARTLLPKDVSK